MNNMNTTRYYHLCVAIASIMMLQATAFGQTFYSQVISNDLPLAYWNFDEAGLTDNAIQQMPVPASPTTVNDLVLAFGATRVAHTAAASGLLLGNAGDFTTAGNFNAPAPDLGPSADLPGPYAVEFWLQVQGAGAVNVPLGFDNAGDRSIYYNNVPNALELYGGGGGRTGGPALSRRNPHDRPLFIAPFASRAKGHLPRREALSQGGHHP